MKQSEKNSIKEIWLKKWWQIRRKKEIHKHYCEFISIIANTLKIKIKGENSTKIKEYTRSIFWDEGCMKRIMSFSKIKPIGEWRNGNRNGRKPNGGMIPSKIPEEGNMNTVPQGSSGDSAVSIWELFHPEARELEHLYPECISHCLIATPNPGGDINL